MPKKMHGMLMVVLSMVIPAAWAQTAANEVPRAQSISAKAEQVLTKFIQVLGGTAAHDGIKSSSSKGNILDWQGKQVTFEQYFKSPGKYLRIEHTTRSEIRRGYDGNVEWVQEGKRKPKRVKAQYDIANDLYFHDIVHWKDKFEKAVYRGEADVLDRKAYMLSVTARRPAILYFDQQTGLLLRRDSSLEGVPIQTYYTNYVESGGVKLPWHIETVYYTRTLQKYVVHVKELRTNPPLDDAMFAIPTP